MNPLYNPGSVCLQHQTNIYPLFFNSTSKIKLLSSLEMSVLVEVGKESATISSLQLSSLHPTVVFDLGMHFDFFHQKLFADPALLLLWKAEDIPKSLNRPWHPYHQGTSSSPTGLSTNFLPITFESLSEI